MDKINLAEMALINGIPIKEFVRHTLALYYADAVKHGYKHNLQKFVAELTAKIQSIFYGDSAADEN